MKLNCKLGDLVIFVNAVNKANIGRIARVVDYGSSVVESMDKVWYTWKVELLSGPAPAKSRKTGVIHMKGVATALDAHLRPLRDPDIEHEEQLEKELEQKQLDKELEQI